MASDPENGSVSIEGFNLRYTPNSGLYRGDDAFTYEVSDESKVHSITTVNVEVTSLENGSYSFTETYEGGEFDLGQWRHYSAEEGFSCRHRSWFYIPYIR